MAKYNTVLAKPFHFMEDSILHVDIFTLQSN